MLSRIVQHAPYVFPLPHVANRHRSYLCYLCRYVLVLVYRCLFLLYSFSVLTLRAFARRRIDFAHFLKTNRSLSINHYFRLMALALTEILFTTPLAIFVIVLDIKGSPIGPWRSWADTHLDYSRMDLYPAILWRQSTIVIVAFETTRWVNPLCAFIFFAFFGFADEAKKNYRAAFWKIGGIFGFKAAPSTSKAQVQSVGYVLSIYSSCM